MRIDQPYPMHSLSPVEVQLLQRVETLETLLASAIGVFAKNAPAAAAELTQLQRQAVFSASAASEMAAARYFESRAATSRHGSIMKYPFELIQDSVERTVEINALIAEYFPAVDGMPLATRLPGTVHLVSEPAPFDAKADQPDGFYRSALLSLHGGEEVLVVLTSLDPDHRMLIRPTDGYWAFYSTVDGEPGHYFLHHQSQYVEDHKLDSALKALLVKPLSAKQRSYYKADEDVDAKLALVLKKIFEGPLDTVAHLDKEDLYKVNMRYGPIDKEGKTVAVTMHVYGEGPDLLIMPGLADHLLVHAGGNQLNRYPFDKLPTSTKVFLLDWLTQLQKSKKAA